MGWDSASAFQTRIFRALGGPSPHPPGPRSGVAFLVGLETNTCLDVEQALGPGKSLSSVTGEAGAVLGTWCLTCGEMGRGLALWGGRRHGEGRAVRREGLPWVCNTAVCLFGYPKLLGKW